MDSVVFPQIDAMGGDAGLSIPKRQFSDSLFAIVKLGDYDGRLILVRPNAQVIQFPGGAGYLITNDHRYLFSISQSDCQGIDIIRLTDLASIYKADCLPGQPDYWYIHNHHYFFVSIDQPDSAYFYLGRQRGFVARPFDRKSKSTSEAAQYDFPP